MIARQMQFVEMDHAGNASSAGHAPFLDYQPLATSLQSLVHPVLESDWLKDNGAPGAFSGGLENTARAYAVQHLVPPMIAETKQNREEMVAKTLAAVKDRLTKEISYWDHRSQELKAQEQAGRGQRPFEFCTGTAPRR